MFSVSFQQININPDGWVQVVLVLFYFETGFSPPSVCVYKVCVCVHAQVCNGMCVCLTIHTVYLTYKPRHCCASPWTTEQGETCGGSDVLSKARRFFFEVKLKANETEKWSFFNIIIIEKDPVIDAPAHPEALSSVSQWGLSLTSGVLLYEVMKLSHVSSQQFNKICSWKNVKI